MNRFALPAMLACLLLPGTAAAETNDCTPITSLPATIASQGVYCLTGDLGTAISTGAAIELANNNITLDCNGYKIGGLAAGIQTQATGVNATSRSNITIRNCNVRGFMSGIVLSSGQYQGNPGVGNIVEHNRLDGNTSTGILVQAHASVVRRNLVSDTGGGPYQGAIGVWVEDGTDLFDNTVDGVFERVGYANYSVGYWIGSSTATVRGNRARNIQSTFGSVGFSSRFGSAVEFRDNFASNPIGDGQNLGFDCGSETDVLFVGNATAGFATGYSYTCLDGGGNAELPPPEA